MTSARRAHHRIWPWRTGLLVTLGALVVVLAATGWLLRPRASAISLVATLGPSGGPGTARPLAFSPDGSILAVERKSAGIELWDVAARKVRRELPLPGLVHGAAFSPDGRRIAATRYAPGPPSKETVVVLDVATGAELFRFEGEHLVFPNLLFDRDGTTLRLLGWNTSSPPGVIEIRALDTATSKLLPSRPLPIAPTQNLTTVSSDGRSVVEGNYGVSMVTVWDLTRDPPTSTPLGPPSKRAATWRLWSLGISHDGATVIAGLWDGSIELWDVATRRLRATLRPYPRGFVPVQVAFSDVRKAASRGDFIPSATLAGRALEVLRWIGSMGRNEFPPSQVAVWDLDNGRILGVLNGQAYPVLTPDGQLMATTDERGSIRLWHVPGVSIEQRTSARP